MSKMASLCERISAETSLHEYFTHNGYIFNGKLDSIVCRMCGFKTRGTLPIDHIQFMHKLYNLECEMVAYKPEKYENFATAKLCVRNYLSAKKFIIKTGVNNYSSAKQFVKETEDLMLFTFASWPKRLPSIEKLVAAGFYYTGVSDEVICIECKVVLHDWEITDNPLTEHEKVSPKCLLVKIQKANV